MGGLRNVVLRVLENTPLEYYIFSTGRVIIVVGTT